jgi:hypothetical protein
MAASSNFSFLQEYDPEVCDGPVHRWTGLSAAVRVGLFSQDDLYASAERAKVAAAIDCRRS